MIPHNFCLCIHLMHLRNTDLGNSVIAVDGNEKVNLETLNFTRKPPGHHSLKLKQLCKVHIVRHNLLYL